ncbi:Glycosyltransferase involved in cell wall bisynthesis [Halobiforma haloterrestris]|uniref:Glycosyltransferase involved in cell wall bisynthesis n=1 Tax=Natronobacterium haloterrestre TaxID=148448 RepID=A0A1I1HDV9_NATHA|nr:glycosyltransferase family 2 protein [Halobiforma haloterrestris]SFC19290.1 Glycosyltransferase involved in cell wall bisynthesis [Halobiforma haloterrestris]
MYRDATVGVVLPAYDEEGFVGDVIRDMPDYVDRIYAIDDQSTDGTWTEILEAARADAGDGRPARERSDPDTDRLVADGGTAALESRAYVHERIGRVVPIQHRENRGAGGAIKTGYLAARADGVDATVTVDADGQMDLSRMPRLLDPIVEGEADYAKGNRLLSAEYRAAMPRFRFVGNAMLSFLTKVAAGYWKTMDPQNGYTAISRNALEAIDLEGLYEYYGYCNDLLVKLNVRGMRVADVAMPAVYGDEESSIRYSEYVPKVSTMLLRNFLWRLKTKYFVLDFHPLALFYLVGAGMAGAGVLALGLALLSALAIVAVPVAGVGGLLLLVAGVAFLLFAMVFDMGQSEHLETQVR